MICFKHERIRVAAAVVLTVMSVSVYSTARAYSYETSFPEEPERYDSEYYLDMLTMKYDRNWRELWETNDNIFRLRLGSLNVEQWAFREQLKFSSELSRRFRLRYWMDKERTLNEDNGTRNEIEIEYRILKDIYLSLFIAPSFWKRENDAAIGLQRRTAVDRYYRLIFKVHDFANNFSYEHSDRIEGENNLYKRQPLELILDVRDRIGSSMRFGVNGSYLRNWRKEYRFLDHPEDNYNEEGQRRCLDIWIEKKMSPSLLFNLDIKGAHYSAVRDGLEEEHRVAEFTPRVWWYPGGLRQSGIEAGIDKYNRNIIKEKTGPVEEEDKSARLPKRSHFSVCAGFQVRYEKWKARGVDPGDFRKDELLPFCLIRSRISSRNILEAGYLADRYKSERTGSLAGESARWENRIKLAWEFLFNGKSRIRVIETLDLDPEDWGEFSLHDHFFVMMQVVF